MSPSSKATITSHDIQDITVPRVAIELDHDEADRFGAFAEDAIAEEDAYQANADLSRD
jgi:hypothetical protein